MPNKKTNPHQIAQIKAMQYLRDKYRAEYSAVYRAEVVAAGGKCHPTNQERIARLQQEIKQLESRGV
jgi:hypothetical protein